MAACAVLPKVDEVPPIEIPSLVGPSMTTEPRSVVSPMDLGIVVAPEPDTIVEDMIIPLEDPVSLRPAKVEVASPAPALDLGPPPLLPKPTVRIEPEKRKPVSLPTAPAARLGSTASLPDSERTGTIQLPSEGRGTMWLLAFLFLCVGGLIAWLLGLFPGL
jgi:hypothetical protein